MPKEEADKLVAGGLVANDDIQPTLKTGQPKGHVDVVMRIERFKDVKAVAEHYIRGPWHEWAETEKPRQADDCNLRCFLQPPTGDSVGPGASDRNSLGHWRFKVEAQGN